MTIAHEIISPDAKVPAAWLIPKAAKPGFVPAPALLPGGLPAPISLLSPFERAALAARREVPGWPS